ncbi:hypothetical protein MSAN_00802700 [Mycena sanguinolenta]|uniref:Mucoidy inhibitor A n=1 Tax=Mycena sanguinolenta TaxID=230812 RepID=A0A8H6Z011_9AGAR|nr:hypothetical protein MSAN_00802700 [Mycena sanguinolenta]
MTITEPPPFEPSKIELNSVTDSKIIAVSLYSTRAEITRLFKFEVKTGQNQVHIAGLPNVLETESLRVEGRGAATIHDVTVSMAKGEHIPTSSPKLSELLSQREKTANALARCEKALTSLEQYLGSLTVQHLEVSHLDKVLEQYDSTGGRLDVKKTELTEELRRLDAEISDERVLIAVPHENSKLRMQAAIGVFADSEGAVEIALIYAVPNATWTAFYDIRVDMDTKEDPVTLIYKAAIKQNTGESWDDVPLQLETSTPTFGLGVPTLSPWNLSVYQPPPPMQMQRAVKSARKSRSFALPSMPALPLASAALLGGEDEYQLPEMRYEDASVTSKGNVSATFRVPGLVTIPCDGDAHNFTIVQLSLKAAMSWVSVPKMDAKTHLNARITNASEYTLLAGSASVYVDGSFISRSDVPAVSPQESFDCPLGLDPSIRITYHPVLKTRSQSGFYTKTVTHVFSQRITVHNTKAVSIEHLKIVDQIPASQDSQIEVRLVNPALVLPSEGGAGTSKRASVMLKSQPQAPVVNVANGIVAQWDGTDESAVDIDTLGRDRKLNWVCAVPAQGKINLALEWEVTAPARVHVVGL